MSNIPTAEEFFINKSEQLNSDKEDMPQWMINASIEFAKIHVEAALKAASEKGKTSNGTSVVVKDSILNSYPLENIK